MVPASKLDDPHDCHYFQWQSNLHKLITYAIMYGRVEAKFIGDPCDDWSAAIERVK